MKSLPKRINDQMMVALDNLSLCELVCEFLQERGGAPIPSEVRMRGPRRLVVIPGANCGFVTTPIIHGAILDIRRILPFLGISYSNKDGKFSTISSPMWADDYWIGDLGISPVSLEEFDALATTICGTSALSVLSEILVYSNKQMAHFSKSELDENRILENLRLGSRLMIDAVMIFVYDAIGEPRPKLHLINEES